MYSVTPISSGPSNGFTVSSFAPIRSASKGRGVLSSWADTANRDSWSMQISLFESVQLAYTESGFLGFTVLLEAGDKFPCAGFVGSDDEGYLIAPAMRLEAENGKELVLMLISPPALPHRVSAEKTVLNVPDEQGTLRISTSGDSVQCFGTLSSRFKSARVVLNRNPGLSAYRGGFNQTLFTAKAPSEVNAVWKPVGRAFEEQLLVLDPFSLTSDIYDDLLESLHATEENEMGLRSDYVVGDGIGVSYVLRLIVDRGLGRHFSDETRLTVI